jgi:hypothetical protein
MFLTFPRAILSILWRFGGILLPVSSLKPGCRETNDAVEFMAAAQGGADVAMNAITGLVRIVRIGS